MMMMNRFIASLERLAMPAEQQLASLPEGCCKADELALDFDCYCRAEGVRMPSDAKQLVIELEQILRKMGG